jgi:hypothetical protein
MYSKPEKYGASMAASERDPKKWIPVSGKRSCSNRNLERQSIQFEAIRL